jgi:glycerate 2-kinase
LRILIASDKFKGVLTSREVGEALSDQLEQLIPHVSIEVVPISDGGDGLGELLMDALGGEEIIVEASGPNGGVVEAPLRILSDGSAVVDTSLASGLSLLDPSKLKPLEASSLGTGQLIRAALNQKITRVVVGVGGTASTDGGTAAASAIGWRFLDRAGESLPSGGGALRRLARIEPPPQQVDAVVVGAVDVTDPLTGSSGAAFRYAPQKGASKREVLRLERGLRRLEKRIENDLGRQVGHVPGSGAGGGMGAGLMAFFSASLVSGFDLLARAIDLRTSIGRADVVITGEGRLDRQTRSGKAPAKVAAMARSLGKRCVAVVGSSTLSEHEAASMGFADVLTCGTSSDLPTKPQAIAQLNEAAMHLASVLH